MTIATNMAGRGTDILLGGNPDFLARREFAQTEMDENTPEGQQKYQEILEAKRLETKKEHDEVVQLGGLHIWERKDMNPVALTTSCAAAQVDRVTLE